MSKYVVNIESPPAPNGACQSGEVVCATQKDAQQIATFINLLDPAGWTVDSIVEYEEPHVFTFDSYVEGLMGIQVNDTV